MKNYEAAVLRRFHIESLCVVRKMKNYEWAVPHRILVGCQKKRVFGVKIVGTVLGNGDFLLILQAYMAQTTINTGYYVKLGLATAGLGSRILAQLLDLVFISLFEGAVSMVMAIIERGIDHVPTVFYVLWVLFFLLPVLLYHPLCESLNQGQSLGKKIVGLRVVKLDGTATTFGASILRWVMLFVDVLITSGIGVVFIMFTRHSQRIGDIAAGTTVVKLRGNVVRSSYLAEFNFILPDYRPVFSEAARLSINQIEIISRVLFNTSSDRQEYIDQLAEKVSHRLNVAPMPNMNNERFLRTIYNDAYHFNATITA